MSQQWHFSCISLRSYSTVTKGPGKISLSFSLSLSLSLSLSAAQALVEYFSEPVWHSTNIRQEALIWVELTIDFISKHGCVGGFLDEGNCMSKLSAAFRSSAQVVQRKPYSCATFPETEKTSGFFNCESCWIRTSKKAARCRLSHCHLIQPSSLPTSAEM